MTVETASLFGSPHIGVYVYANDDVALIPRDAPPKFSGIVREALGVEPYPVSIARSRLIGVLCAGNNRALILPSIAYEEEVNSLKEMLGDVKIVVLEGLKETTPGNLILANDNACLLSSILPKKLEAKIGEALGTPCVRGTIGEFPLVGAVAVATNRGLLLPPTVGEEEAEKLSNIFKVPGDVATVNRGRIFLRSGMVANSKGALVGEETTGHELMRIQQILFGAAQP